MFIIILSACGKDASTDRAEYNLLENGFSIALDVSPRHPFLAEYNRELFLLKDTENIAKQEMFPDTGGYSDANFYDCGAGKYMIVGYFDFFVIDVNSKNISEEQCEENKRHYIGSFRWGKEKKWRFRLESEQPEEALIPKGG